MKTKLIERPDLEPKTQQDCWKLLAEGFILKDKGNESKIKFIDGCLKWYTSLRDGGYTDICFIGFDQWEVLEEKEINWYDEISEHGILCWVFDGSVYVVDLILEASKFGGKYIGLHGTYENAKPLTKEEVKQHIYNWED